MKIQEIQLRKKQHIGSGMFQNTYEVIGKNNMVVKTKKDGEPYSKDEIQILHIVQEHPYLFAKIHIIKPKFVVMEMLDAKKAIRNYRDVEWSVDSLLGSGEFKYIIEEWYAMGKADFYVEYGQLYDHLEEKGLLYIFEEIADLFTDAGRLFEDYVVGVPDFHEGNIGYDDSGILKMFDW